MAPTADRLTAAIRAVFSLDFALNITREIIPPTHDLLPLGGTQLAQAGLLASVTFVAFEAYEAIRRFRGR